MYKRYENYKDSGVEWIGEIPEHWSISKIKYEAKINNQVLSETTPEDYGLKYLDIGNVDSDGKVIKIERMIFRDAPSRARRIVSDGDILVSTVRTYLKAITWFHKADNNLICSTGFAVLSPKKTIEPKYLSYVMRSSLYVEVIVSRSVGVSYPAISSLEIGRIELIMPPSNTKHSNEQLAIVNFLDHKISEIDSLIADKEKLIKRLEEYKQSIITEAVTKGLNPDVKMKDSGIEWIGEIPEHWEAVQIKHLTRVKRGASPRPIDNPMYFDADGFYSWVRIADVTCAGDYLELTTQKLSEMGASLSVKLEPDTLFVSICATVGKPCITKIHCCIHDGFVFFPDYKGVYKFLFYIFKSGESLKGLGKIGTQLNLNTDTIGKIYIALPPQKEQMIIVGFLDQKMLEVNNLNIIVQKQINNLKELRSSFIFEAVTGKLKVIND